MSSKKTEVISLDFKDGGMGSVRTPNNLKQAIDKFLTVIEHRTGIKYSRNEFILNAIRWYLEMLSESETKSEIIDKLPKN